MSNINEDKVLLIASFLLQYPDGNWRETFEEVIEEVEKIKNEVHAKPIIEFLKYAKNLSELDLAEHYVNTFDFAKKTNLHMTYYRFKEGRERGSALLNLKQKYEESGFLIEENELPDFLPVILEYASAVQSKDILKDYISVIKDIYNNLSKDNNPYAQVLEAVLLIIDCQNNEFNDLNNQEKPVDYTSSGGDAI